MGNHKKKKKKNPDIFSPSGKALQLPNSTLKEKAEASLHYSRTEYMALFGIFTKLLLP